MKDLGYKKKCEEEIRNKRNNDNPHQMIWFKFNQIYDSIQPLVECFSSSSESYTTHLNIWSQY